MFTSGGFEKGNRMHEGEYAPKRTPMSTKAGVSLRVAVASPNHGGGGGLSGSFASIAPLIHLHFNRIHGNKALSVHPTRPFAYTDRPSAGKDVS
jgi:hypothetical protein